MKQTEMQIRDRIRRLSDDYKEQAWQVFRHFHNELKELTDELLNSQKQHNA